MKRQCVKPGDILKVGIDNVSHTYARILNDASVAFYDCKTSEELKDIEKIILSPVLFIITVNREVLISGEWPKIGSIPLEDHLKKNPPKYIKAFGHKNRFEIYDNGKIRPATKDECLGLELMASWAKQHIEERLQYHYDGKTSWLMEQYGPLKNGNLDLLK
jgi:hypothetical protein